MNRKTLITVFLLFLHCGLKAQTDVADSVRLDTVDYIQVGLLQAQDYAIAHNKSFENASLDVKKARVQRWQTIAAMLPQVDANGTYVNMLDYSTELGTSGMKIAMPSYITGGVTASIAVNGQMVVGALLNSVALDMQQITYDKSETELRGNVTKSYVAVLVMQEILELLRESYGNLQKVAEQTRKMADVGTVESTDADQIDIRLVALQNSIKANERNLQLSTNALRVLMGMNEKEHLVLVDKIEDIVSEENVLTALADNFVIEENHNYQLLEKQVELAKKNKQLAAWAYGPTLALSYQYSKRKYLTDESTMNMNPPHLISLSLTMPLFSSGKRFAGVTEQKLNFQQTRNTLEETKD
ncbi:MAG: TolC family protein, partial [Paludibacteraceae bacterium]|nr:TolC family protein [Paludibacteraceae bacterium]